MKRFLMVGLMILTTLCGAYEAREVNGEMPMVVVIPSYNNMQWYRWNLDSVVAQKYSNFRIVYIDDVSTDGTTQAVEEYFTTKACGCVTLIKNKERRGALYNLYHAIHACADNEVVICLDGDDALAHDGVLARVNKEYQQPGVWLTYGQYQEVPTNKTGFSKVISTDIIQRNAFRSLSNVYSHLRTFYAGLFKKIAQEDLMYEGKFFEMTWDMAMMLPMLEMAGERHSCIPDVLYLYNRLNVISDCYKNQRLQEKLAYIIKGMPAYQRLDESQASWMQVHA